MEQLRTRSVAAPALLRWKNFAASAAIVGFACAAHRFAPHNQVQFETLYGSVAFSFTGVSFLYSGASAYVVLLAAFYATVREAKISKSLRFFRTVAALVRSPAARWRQGLSHEDRVAVLATLLKAFFGPLMAMALMRFCMGALAHGIGIVEDDSFASGFRVLFDRHGFWLLMQIILFIDVLIYTVGYLVELPATGQRDPLGRSNAAGLGCGFGLLSTV